ncbi:MAG TPA: SGNH/GDSL hydrolase family protein [Thermoanaerobaculia bacterium]|nr:SGNH/GDSL hydrolase family protein [Thermoanaerobaculia bacterium]
MNVLVALLLAARFIVVSANDTTVTYRELVPERVAADVSAGVYHYKGCPAITPEMPLLVPAAAQLRGLKPHCPALRKTEYATLTVKRAPRDPSVVSILFLGNSLTYYNEIPKMTERIAAREKRPLRVDAVTRSGITLEQLWNETTALEKIWTQHWDYVVVQGGAGAAHPLYNAAAFNDYLARFATEIRKSGATPLYYLVWRPEGDINEFIAASLASAKRVNMRVVPVAVAWREVSARHRLDQDGLHPNSFGAYLVACNVYSTIYDKPAHGAPFSFRDLAAQHEIYDDGIRLQTITPEDARAIQDAAWRAVLSAKKQ